LVTNLSTPAAGRVPEKSNEEFEQVLSVLDPTCGSGAFLFAALNVLESLVEKCIERMLSFVEEADRQGRHAAHPAFRRVLTETAKHMNEEYFILKSIIVGDLYGVDIMQEATEICKLRLFLKLVAQVELDDRQANMGLEPLPDVDFNIKTGNTLVGFVDERSVDKAFDGEGQGRFDYDNGKTRFKEAANITRRIFEQFRLQQVKYGGTVTARDKAALRDRLKQQADQLDVYLAHEYGIDTNKQLLFEAWRKSHQPFHWFTEFYGIITGGGFDVIIGNPPYVEYKDVSQTYKVKSYATHDCGNLFAYIVERCQQLGRVNGYIGMIAPISAFSTDRMIPLINEVKAKSSLTYISNFSWRPGKLFDGVNLQLSIILEKLGMDRNETFSTRYLLWDSEARPELFSKIEYVPATDERLLGAIPKLGDEKAKNILEKLRSSSSEMSACFAKRSGNIVFYRRGGLYWKVFVDFETESSEEKLINVQPEIDRYLVIAALSSNLWFWYLMATSDCRHLGNRDIDTFPFDVKSLSPAEAHGLSKLGRNYVADLKHNAQKKKRVYKGTKAVNCISFEVKKSKLIIDEIDRMLAAHYSFTAEELDFIINYDIKYRMGSTELGSDE
jgi:hypothetical protein